MAVIAHRYISFSEPRIGERVGWVEFDSLTEILNGFGEPFLGSLSPIELALQIQMIGLYIVGITPGEEVLLFGSQLQSQLLRDFSGNVLFDGKNVVLASAVLRCPQLPPILDFHQLGADQ